MRELFSRFVGPVIDKVLGLRCTSFGYQQDTLERIFSNLESEDIHIRRARMDCGSCSRKIVETVEKHSEHFYIRANNCSSLYDSLLALRGWQRQEINGIEYELNSIITEKLDTKAFGLKKTSRIKAFVFKFISVPAKWIRTARHYELNIYTDNQSYLNPFALADG